MQAKSTRLSKRFLVLLASALSLINSLFLPVPLQAANSDVVINEVLANAADEDTGELVELYNTGTTAVDVQGWYLCEPGEDDDPIMDYTGTSDWGLAGTSIPSGGYAIIVDPEYAGEYNTYLESNADSEKVVMLTIGQDTELGNRLANTGDTITIDDDSGYTTSFTWTSDAGDNTSWEKKNPTGGDSLSNRGVCTDPNGSTPGVQNSIYDPTSITLSSFAAHPTTPQPTFLPWQCLALAGAVVAFGGVAAARRWLRQ